MLHLIRKKLTKKYSPVKALLVFGYPSSVKLPVVQRQGVAAQGERQDQRQEQGDGFFHVGFLSFFSFSSYGLPVANSSDAIIMPSLSRFNISTVSQKEYEPLPLLCGGNASRSAMK